MESAANAGELERARRAFMARMARLALPAKGGLDRRDAMVLIDCDVIRPEAESSSASEVESLRKGAAAVSGTEPPGPLLFYPGEEGGKSVVRARDLILDQRREVRDVGVAHLQGAARLPMQMCPWTRDVIQREAHAITSADGQVWRRAAINVVDAVDDDWLLNVAGMHQSKHPAMRELWSEYVNAVFRPSVAAVNRCSPSMLCPGLHHGAMHDAAEALGGSQLPAPEHLHRYIHTLGHVPLELGCSLTSTLMDAAPGDPTATKLAAVLEAASKTLSPVVRYHACEAALARAGNLSPAQFDEVSAWFWEAVLPSAGGLKPSESQAGWSLMAQMARYFVQYLEVRLPSDHGEAISSMAWWMTIRVMHVLDGPAEEMLGFGQQLEQVYGGATASTWDILGSAMSASPLRWLTLHGASPWSLSLISAVRSSEDMNRLMVGSGIGTADERVAALITIAMQIANLPLDQSRFRFAENAREALGWAAAGIKEEDKREMLSVWAEGIDWTNADSLQKALDGFGQKELSVQRWVSHAVRQRLSTTTLIGDELWKIVSSDGWKRDVWPRLDPLAVQALGYALTDDAVRRAPEWLPHLPHLLAEVAEQRAANETDRQAFFGVLLRASCALNAPSALSRLLRGRSGHRYRPLATAVRGNLEQLLPQAGGWAAGKLRALIVDLHP